jgi:hypothetical protein
LEGLLDPKCITAEDCVTVEETTVWIYEGRQYATYVADFFEDGTEEQLWEDYHEHWQSRKGKGIRRGPSKTNPEEVMYSVGLRSPQASGGAFGVYSTVVEGEFKDNLDLTAYMTNAVVEESARFAELFPTQYRDLSLAAVRGAGVLPGTYGPTPWTAKHITLNYNNPPHKDQNDNLSGAILWFGRNMVEDGSVVEYEQYFVMLELGVKVLVQHNAMVMLDARRITHFSSKPNVSVEEYRMYGTALVQSKRTLDAAEDLSLNILQDLHQGWVDSRRAEVVKVAGAQNKTGTCQPETVEGADLHEDTEQDEDHTPGEDQDQDQDLDQEQDLDLEEDQDLDEDQDKDSEQDAEHDSQMAEELDGLAPCTSHPKKAAKVKFLYNGIVSP